MAVATEPIIEWIRSNCSSANTDNPLVEGTALLDAGILDSIQIIQLVSFLESEHGITVDADDVSPENFESPKAIAGLVERLLAEKAGA